MSQPRIDPYTAKIIASMKAKERRSDAIIEKIARFVPQHGAYTKDVAKESGISAKKIVDALNDRTGNKYRLRLSGGILDSESEKIGIASSQMLIMIK